MILIPAFTPIYYTDYSQDGYLVQVTDLKVVVTRVEKFYRRRVYFMIETTEYWCFEDDIHYMN